MNWRWTARFFAVFLCRMFRVLHQVSGRGALRLPGGDHPLLLGCGTLLWLRPRGADRHPNYAGEPLLQGHQWPRHPHPGVSSREAVWATHSWKKTATVQICLLCPGSRSFSTSSTASPPSSSYMPSSFWLRAFTPLAPSRRSCRVTLRPPSVDAASLLLYV